VRATKVNAGLAESNGRLLLGIWRDSLHLTCGLTACTPGSALGATLGNEYGKTLPFTFSNEKRFVPCAVEKQDRRRRPRFATAYIIRLQAYGLLLQPRPTA